ncbi:MAG: chain length determinant protein EpsF, partial [Burkholderiales bacterium]|nr:chain length determinant protein EpsF [Burkholderiales bacterium]
MSFSQFLGVLKARLWVVLLALVLTVGVAVALSLLLPKQYSAETNLVIDFKGTDPVMGMMLPLQMMPGYMATQVDIIQSKKVAKEVVRGLKLAEAPGARDQWMDETEGRGSIEDFYADLLLKKLDVQPARESSMITIKFSGSEPRFAAAIANAFAVAYQRTNLELRVEPARQSALWFDDQLQSL